MREVREKHHRLPADCYKGRVTVALTLCLKERITGLNDPDVFKYLEDLLLSELNYGRCEAHIYLMMPDHCHLLLEGREDDSKVLDVVKRFKQKTGYWFSRCNPNLHWQKDFYDHIIHSEQSLKKHLHYILDNPVRQEMVDNWLQYEFKGSTLYDFNQW